MKVTSIEQALIDLKKAGGSSSYIDYLLDELKSSKELLEQSEELFHSHLYPDKSINWFKHYNSYEFERILNPYEFKILTLMAKNMNISNLIQISQNDLKAITGLNKRTISDSLKNLIDNGYIAIKLLGNSRNANVYMVNPLFATVGTGNQELLTNEFWKLTGDIYDNTGYKVIEKSLPHFRFNNISKEQTYSRGHNRQETTDGIIYFNKINPPKNKKSPDVFATTRSEDNSDLPI